ncbi:MAG: precorrin-6A synthase (deacetylating) [Chloroflexota bacterium]
MRTMLAVGIGAGDPKYVTIQAIEALNRADVLFVVDKGSEKDGLVQLRREICDRYVTNTRYRSVQIEDPVRDRTAGAYREAVEDWRRRRADAYQGAIRDHLADGQCGALLVWGDPSLYDSTLAILDDVAARGDPPIEYEVIAGISSVQALAARHKTTLNRVGGSVTVTTGRRLARGLPADADDVVVMLDAERAFHTVSEPDVEIFWGAYVGTDDELLVSGPLSEVADEIERVRAEARARHGWIMDTYLLRRRRT